ncbi:MAG: hypothetical protein CMJ25_13610 [Phycisphaerae bacterium]|nr:hypothetical protein [Phycisphaerae bacterium]|tara:strand:- start:294 stop:731 length:438 start_codon:yes stop_codon:yes gene_type:complete
MNTYQVLFIGAFFALTIPKQTRFASSIIIFFNVVYFLFVIDLDWVEYYLYSATLNAVLGVILFFFNCRLVGLLSFFLIPANILGYVLCKNYYDPFVYDTMCAIIILLQILVLTIRGLTDGADIRHKDGPLVFLVNFDSNKNRAKM